MAKKFNKGLAITSVVLALLAPFAFSIGFGGYAGIYFDFLVKIFSEGFNIIQLIAFIPVILVSAVLYYTLNTTWKWYIKYPLATVSWIFLPTISFIILFIVLATILG